MRKLTIKLILCLILLSPLSYATDIDLGVIMPPEACRVSCVDKESGITYSVGLEAKAYINFDIDDNCGLEVNQYYYINDVRGEPYLIQLREPTGDSQYYGGYIHRENRDNEDVIEDTTWGRGFRTMFGRILNWWHVIWQMYYENQVAVSQDENGIITVTSDNTINPCQIGTYAEVHLMCDATASATEQVAVGCTLYTDGNPQDPLQIISSHSEGDMPDYSKYTKLAYLEHSGGCNLDTWVSFDPSGDAYQTFEECN